MDTVRMKYTKEKINRMKYVDRIRRQDTGMMLFNGKDESNGNFLEERHRRLIGDRYKEKEKRNLIGLLASADRKRGTKGGV